MAFDIQDLTLAEIEEFERRAKMSVTMLPRDEAVKGTPLRALALVVGRRSDPSMSWERAGELSMREANALIGLGQPDADPNSATSNGSKP